VPDDQWRALLAGCLRRADEFRVRMPDGEGPLSYGRQEFLALPGAAVRPWAGMRDAIEITGPLTPVAGLPSDRPAVLHYRPCKRPG
jgi:hypothetical protein